MHPLQLRLRAAGNPHDAALLARFFKTGPGQYGEGDVFLGIRVPAVRKMARPFAAIPLEEIETLSEELELEEHSAPAMATAAE